MNSGISNGRIRTLISAVTAGLLILGAAFGLLLKIEGNSLSISNIKERFVQKSGVIDNNYAQLLVMREQISTLCASVSRVEANVIELRKERKEDIAELHRRITEQLRSRINEHR